MHRKGDPVDFKDVEYSLSIALKLAKFRPTRGITESDEVCRRAAKVIIESFKRNGWAVVHESGYPGWGAEGTGVFMNQQEPYKRCENCDD